MAFRSAGACGALTDSGPGQGSATDEALDDGAGTSAFCCNGGFWLGCELRVCGGVSDGTSGATVASLLLELPEKSCCGTPGVVKGDWFSTGALAPGITLGSVGVFA